MGNEESTMSDPGAPPATLYDRHLKAVADYIKEGQAKRIVVMTGAGLSTAAGIPDFRSPGTGLYANLARLKLPYAEAVFDIDYFRKHPEPFYVLAKELYPGQFHPTVSHAFIALLARKGLLLMNFTQNIDCLERRAGVPDDRIIEAHGSFATQRCVDCQTAFPDDRMREHVAGGAVPRCADPRCGGLVKPDIVFFGEALPARFRHNTDLAAQADLVLVVGTSLTVFPFAGLPEAARDGVPRVLFNKERVGRMGSRPDDVLELGACDDGVRKLATLLGWRDELEALWRDVVGDKEVHRQLAVAGAKGQDEIEDEVQKLTEEVESALKLSSSGKEDQEEQPEEKKAESKTSAAATLKAETHAAAAKDQPGDKADPSRLRDMDEAFAGVVTGKRQDQEAAETANDNGVAAKEEETDSKARGETKPGAAKPSPGDDAPTATASQAESPKEAASPKLS